MPTEAAFITTTIVTQEDLADLVSQFGGYLQSPGVSSACSLARWLVGRGVGFSARDICMVHLWL
jgi:hypothetical protein